MALVGNKIPVDAYGQSGFLQRPKQTHLAEIAYIACVSVLHSALPYSRLDTNIQNDYSEKRRENQ
jgi:hypothetical protein